MATRERRAERLRASDSEARIRLEGNFERLEAALPAYVAMNRTLRPAVGAALLPVAREEIHRLRELEEVVAPALEMLRRHVLGAAWGRDSAPHVLQEKLETARKMPRETLLRFRPEVAFTRDGSLLHLLEEASPAVSPTGLRRSAALSQERRILRGLALGLGGALGLGAYLVLSHYSRVGWLFSALVILPSEFISKSLYRRRHAWTSIDVKDSSLVLWSGCGKPTREREIHMGTLYRRVYLEQNQRGIRIVLDGPGGVRVARRTLADTFELDVVDELAAGVPLPFDPR